MNTGATFTPVPAPVPARSFPLGRRRAILVAVVLLAVAGVLVVLLDWPEVQGVIGRASWRLVLPALAITAFSYLCLSWSFGLVNQAFGVRPGQWILLGVGFVSSAMIAAVGGVAGHSLRLLLMVRRGVAASDAMAPSLFHGYLESVIFFAMIPGGLAYLVFTHPLSPRLTLTLGTGAGVLGVAFAVTAVVFFVRPVRAVALRLVGLTWRLVLRRDLDAGLRSFEATLVRGLAEVRRRPLSLVLPVLLILADRLSRVMVVWLCFEALGGQVDLGVVVTGFAIGVVAGVMSMVPGGLGVQEGTMAGVYHLLGVSLEQAVLVSLLFRLVYYMVPLAVSLVFYWHVLRVGSSEPPASAEVA